MKFWWLKFHKGVQKGIFYDHRAINFKNIFSIQKNISTTARQLNILSGSFSNCKFCLLDPTGNCLDWSTTWPIHPFLRPAPYPSNLRTILINPKDYIERKRKEILFFKQEMIKNVPNSRISVFSASPYPSNIHTVSINFQPTQPYLIPLNNTYLIILKYDYVGAFVF